MYGFCRWLGTGTFNGAVAFHTAGVQFIGFRSDIVPYGHSNVRVLDSSVDDIVNETFTCRVNFESDEFRWNTTIVQPRKFTFNVEIMLFSCKRYQMNTSQCALLLGQS